MGGNALKHLGVETKRLEKQEYTRIVQDISDVLASNGFIFHVVQAYRNKETFGDLDTVICHEDTSIFSKFINEVFKPTAIYRNSNTFSFDYQNFQVDFIIHGREVFNAAVDYYDFSPCGNAVGKLAHQFGLSYGHEGLVYVIREEHVGADSTENSHVLKEVVLSTDSEEIHTFFDLNHHVWLDGFDKEEEIFAWVANSKYFNPNLFSLEAMNHRARVRDKKRADYNRLMKWIDDNKDYLPDYQPLSSKSSYLPWIVAHFPKLKDEMDQCREEYVENQIIKSKFNGHLVSAWTHIDDGQKLGYIIKGFKESVENLRSFLLQNTHEEVERYFRAWYTKQNE